LCHLTLQYIDWLSKMLLPDTSETEWLDRHGNIWLINADGTTGRKGATLAYGVVNFTGLAGTIVPKSTQLGASGTGIQYETLEEITLGVTPTPAAVRALDPGSLGNLPEGAQLGLAAPIPGVDDIVTVDEITYGVDEESDDELRMRVLERIRQPPMGGDQEDYVNWALRVPGVTRAWSAPLEMGIGTVTVRFMMDNLRADNDGLPTAQDVDTVQTYLDTVRPVAVKDFWAEAPIPYPIDVHITNLSVDDAATRGAITNSLLAKFMERTQPGQTWYRSWTDEGIAGAAGVDYYDLTGSDTVMPDNGHMPMLGTITYD
jgi:uncharacterized phage protein gp47/JayE